MATLTTTPNSNTLTPQREVVLNGKPASPTIRPVGGYMPDQTPIETETEPETGVNDRMIFHTRVKEVLNKKPQEPLKPTMDFFAQTKVEWSNEKPSGLTNKGLNFHSPDRLAVEFHPNTKPQESSPILSAVTENSLNFASDAVQTTAEGLVSGVKDAFKAVTDLGTDILGIEKKSPEDNLTPAQQQKQVEQQADFRLAQSRIHETGKAQSGVRQEQVVQAQIQELGAPVSEQQIQDMLGINTADVTSPYHIARMRDAQREQMQQRMTGMNVPKSGNGALSALDRQTNRDFAPEAGGNNGSVITLVG